jgi:hypothetical protein
MIVFIYPAVTVNAGADQIKCASLDPIQLAGSIGGSAISATWSGGTGAFNPNASTLNATYTPTAADIAAGSVTLTLTTNDPAGPCGPLSDQVKLTLDQPAVSVADRSLCAGMPPVQLCANVTRGVSPYTYRWSNGATTSCIAVADPGSYTVTITDAIGCQAAGTGTVIREECPGMIAHTSTTCQSYGAGNGDELLQADIKVSTSNNVISNVAPGVLFYWSKVRAPRSDFRVDIQQIKTDARFPYISVFQVQVALYDANCSGAGSGIETGPGQASADVHGAIPGQTYIIAVKYSFKSLIGTYMDPTMGCHYDFHTVVDGLVVDADPDGFWIGVPQLIIGAGDGTNPNGDPSGGDSGDEGIQLPGGLAAAAPVARRLRPAVATAVAAVAAGGGGGGGGGGTTAGTVATGPRRTRCGRRLLQQRAGHGRDVRSSGRSPTRSCPGCTWRTRRAVTASTWTSASTTSPGARVKTLENGIVGWAATTWHGTAATSPACGCAAACTSSTSAWGRRRDRCASRSSTDLRVRDRRKPGWCVGGLVHGAPVRLVERRGVR